MLNEKMIEKFKNFKNDVNDYNVFDFYTFDEFINCYFDLCNNNDELHELKNEINVFIDRYNCNDENTIVLLYNCDDDEFLFVNFENNNLIVAQHFDICNVNDDYCKNALYEILKFMFTNECYVDCYTINKNN